MRLLPETPARRFRALVLEGMADLFAFDELRRLLKRRIAMAVVLESQLSAASDRHYWRSEEVSGLANAH